MLYDEDEVTPYDELAELPMAEMIEWVREPRRERAVEEVAE